MALTTPTLVNELPIARSGPWCVNNNENDASTSVVMKAAPGAGYALYVTSLTLSGQLLDVAVTLVDEDDTVLFGPIQMQADGGGVFTKDWKYPLKLIDNKDLHVKADGATAFTAYVEGWTGQSPIT